MLFVAGDSPLWLYLIGIKQIILTEKWVEEVLISLTTAEEKPITSALGAAKRNGIWPIIGAPFLSDTIGNYFIWKLLICFQM